MKMVSVIVRMIVLAFQIIVEYAIMIQLMTVHKIVMVIMAVQPMKMVVEIVLEEIQG